MALPWKAKVMLMEKVVVTPWFSQVYGGGQDWSPEPYSIPSPTRMQDWHASRKRHGRTNLLIPTLTQLTMEVRKQWKRSNGG
jgi:hypothetical protein